MKKLFNIQLASTLKLKHCETNQLHISTHLQGFPIVPRAHQQRGDKEVLWFGRSQCEKQKQTNNFHPPKQILEIIELSTQSHPVLWSRFIHYPLFQWYPQSKKFVFQYNLQGSRVIIVVVQVRAVKTQCRSSPSFSGIRKVRNLFFNIITRFESNYSSCTSRSSENTCISSGGAQEKGKTG